MGLRKKTLLAISTTLILMVVIIYSITSAILLGGYAKLERQNILQNANQAMKMLDDELAQLKSVVGDWAPWDDTYQFVQDINQGYIASIDKTFSFRVRQTLKMTSKNIS